MTQGALDNQPIDWLITVCEFHGGSHAVRKTETTVDGGGGLREVGRAQDCKGGCGNRAAECRQSGPAAGERGAPPPGATSGSGQKASSQAWLRRMAHLIRPTIE